MIRFAAVLAFIAALLAGCASQDYAGGSIQVGKVAGVYVEEYTGVYIQRQLATNSKDKPVWALVMFAEPLKDGRQSVTAMVPADLNVEVGDMVELRIAGENMEVERLVPEHNQVTALLAKAATANAFGYSKVPAASVIRTAAQGRDDPL